MEIVEFHNYMNVDTLIHQYFPSAENVCIEMFDEKNIQQVYRRLVEVLIHQPEVETSLYQGSGIRRKGNGVRPVFYIKTDQHCRT